MKKKPVMAISFTDKTFKGSYNVWASKSIYLILDEWKHFVGSNKKSLKCVLLYNGKEYSAVPIGHSIYVKEEYEEIETVLNLLKNLFYWDNKVVTPSTPTFCVFGTVELKNDIWCKEIGWSVKC